MLMRAIGLVFVAAVLATQVPGAFEVAAERHARRPR